MYGQALEQVNEYKYLGIEVGKSTTSQWHSYVERATAKCTTTQSLLLLQGGSYNQLSPRASTRLWSSLCRPILEYGACLIAWNSVQEQKLEAIQMKYAKAVLGCGAGVSNVFIQSELGLTSMKSRSDELKLRYWYDLCAKSSDSSSSWLAHYFQRGMSDINARVAAGVALPPPTRCIMRCMLDLLSKYSLQREWTTHHTHEAYTKEQWSKLVKKKITQAEKDERAQLMCAQSSLSKYTCYSDCLVPAYGELAVYLDDATNEEGTWLKVRLRSNTLPLYSVLGVHAVPRWSDAMMRCQVCDNEHGEVESASHFLTQCAAYTHLRVECVRRGLQWLEEQRRSELAQSEESALAFIEQTVTSMQLIEQIKSGERTVESVPPFDWELTRANFLSLLLGRCRHEETNNNFPSSTNTGRRHEWSSPLVFSLHLLSRNYILLCWRERMRVLGGEPHLDAARCALHPLHKPYKAWSRSRNSNGKHRSAWRAEGKKHDAKKSKKEMQLHKQRKKQARAERPPQPTPPPLPVFLPCV